MDATYELMVVTGGDKDDSTRSDRIEEIKKLIEAEKGQIQSVDDWGKKQLAYKISKMQSGHFTLITFQAKPQVPSNLNSKMRLMESLLRYLIVRKEGEKIITKIGEPKKLVKKVKDTEKGSKG